MKKSEKRHSFERPGKSNLEFMNIGESNDTKGLKKAKSMLGDG